MMNWFLGFVAAVTPQTDAPDIAAAIEHEYVSAQQCVLVPNNETWQVFSQTEPLVLETLGDDLYYLSDDTLNLFPPNFIAAWRNRANSEIYTTYHIQFGTAVNPDGYDTYTIGAILNTDWIENYQGGYESGDDDNSICFYSGQPSNRKITDIWPMADIDSNVCGAENIFIARIEYDYTYNDGFEEFFRTQPAGAFHDFAPRRQGVYWLHTDGESWEAMAAGSNAVDAQVFNLMQYMLPLAQRREWLDGEGNWTAETFDTLVIDGDATTPLIEASATTQE